MLHAQTIYNFRVVRRHLDLTECAGLEDAGLSSIVECCPKLEAVILDWCWALTDQSIGKLVRQCPEITDLKLVGITRLSSAPFEKVRTTRTVTLVASYFSSASNHSTSNCCVFLFFST